MTKARFQFSLPRYHTRYSLYWYSSVLLVQHYKNAYSKYVLRAAFYAGTVLPGTWYYEYTGVVRRMHQYGPGTS